MRSGSAVSLRTRRRRGGARWPGVRLSARSPAPWPRRQGRPLGAGRAPGGPRWGLRDAPMSPQRWGRGSRALVPPAPRAGLGLRAGRGEGESERAPSGGVRQRWRRGCWLGTGEAGRRPARGSGAVEGVLRWREKSISESLQPPVGVALNVLPPLTAAVAVPPARRPSAEPPCVPAAQRDTPRPSVLPAARSLPHPAPGSAQGTPRAS